MIPTPTIEVDYPSSDGQPIAETPLHFEAIMLLHQALQDFFRDRTDVFVASDIFWYWEEGNPNARISPDVMVVTGVEPKPLRDRPSFFSWKEKNVVPAAIFEMASEGTWRDDLDDKFDSYEQLGVREYFLFDPEGLHLVPPLQGYRLQGRAFRRQRTNAVESELGFRLRAEGPLLRLVDVRTGEPIPTRAEAADRANCEAEEARREIEEAEREAEQAEREADAAQQRADALAAEVEQLKRLLAGGPS